MLNLDSLTLKYFFEIKKNSIEKSKGSIGIIPYIYSEAALYYEKRDKEQKEMAEAFGCCNQAISKALKRCGITRKKRQYATKNRILKK